MSSAEIRNGGVPAPPTGRGLSAGGPPPGRPLLPAELALLLGDALAGHQRVADRRAMRGAASTAMTATASQMPATMGNQAPSPLGYGYTFR